MQIGQNLCAVCKNSMSRFFVPKENISEKDITVTGEDVVHISKVLRAKKGDILTFFDGRGNDYQTEISDISKNAVLCKILNKTKSETEPNIKVTLIQGVPKAAKMDYIIQKTTELGICDIFPCSLNRCVSKIEGEKKIIRWQKIAKEAAQQSGRGIIPKIHSEIDLKGAAEILSDADISFVPYECEDKTTIKSALLSKKEPKTVAFLIGPEGGFEQSEIEFLKNNGISTVSLGKRILRTETAGEAVLSMIMYEIGDVNGI